MLTYNISIGNLYLLLPPRLIVAFNGLPTVTLIALVVGSGGVLVKKPLFGAGGDPTITSLLPIWMDGVDAYRLCGLDDDFISDDAVQVRSRLLAGQTIDQR